jgi:hypothetical protein
MPPRARYDVAQTAWSTDLPADPHIHVPFMLVSHYRQTTSLQSPASPVKLTPSVECHGLFIKSTDPNGSIRPARILHTRLGIRSPDCNDSSESTWGATKPHLQRTARGIVPLLRYIRRTKLRRSLQQAIPQRDHDPHRHLSRLQAYTLRSSFGILLK